jgi:hypothetical protein
MSDPITLFALVSAGIAGLCIAAAAGLKGWHGWLELKRIEIAGGVPREPVPASPAARIELADLKERVRKLEAIANGIE